MAQAAGHVDAIDVSASLIRRAEARATQAGVMHITFSVASQVPDGRQDDYDFVSAMGVLVCLVDDHSFVATLDKVAHAVRVDGYLLLRETVSGLGRVVFEREDYVACYRPRASMLEPLERLGFELVLDRKLADWSADEQRTSHLWLLRRKSARPT